MKLAVVLRRRRLQLLSAAASLLCVSAVVRLYRVTARHLTTQRPLAAGRPSGTTPPPASEDHQRCETYDDIWRLMSVPSSGPPNLRSPGRRDHSQHGQSRFVDDHLRRRRNGFFVESGAGDGETGSNSLFFERHRNWTGLLVEANTQSYRQLLDKRRRAYAINACIGPSRRPVSAVFKPAGGIGGLADQMSAGHLALVNRYGAADLNVTCYPINDVVAVLNVSRVDYWSLDVEGAELAVLGSVDWASMPRVDVISVEFMVKRADGRRDRRASVDKLQQVRRLLEVETGLYQHIGVRHDVDVIFARI